MHSSRVSAWTPYLIAMSSSVPLPEGGGYRFERIRVTEW